MGAGVYLLLTGFFPLTPTLAPEGRGESSAADNKKTPVFVRPALGGSAPSQCVPEEPF